MSDWEDFCQSMKIDPHDPDQFDQLLDRWSKAEEKPMGVQYRAVNLREFLQTHSNQHCGRCGGTGYIGEWKTVERGRCFLCFPDRRWKQLVLE